MDQDVARLGNSDECGVRSAELQKAVEEEMTALVSTYSMQSQRDVHQELLGKSGRGDAFPESSTGVSELGDNAELF